MALPVTSNLLLWLDANQISGPPSDGSNISSWSDSSGNGNTISYGAGTNPVFHANQLNGLPAVEFANARMTFGGSGIAAQTAYSCFIVLKLTATSKGCVTAGGGASFKYWFSSGVQGVDSTGTAQVAKGSAALGSTWHQTNVVYTNNSSSIAFRVDGASDTLGSSVTTTNITTAINLFAIGPFDSEILHAYVAEVALYGAALNSTDVGLMESYFNTRYFAAAAAIRPNNFAVT